MHQSNRFRRQTLAFAFFALGMAFAGGLSSCDKVEAPGAPKGSAAQKTSAGASDSSTAAGQQANAGNANAGRSGSGANAGAATPASEMPTDLPAVTVAASTAEKPWYAARFEALGFHVFPEPIALEDFSTEALGGGSVSMSSLKGKVVLLNFWATWCPPCRLEMPSIETLWKRMKGKDFTVMAVSVGETKATVQKFIASEKYSFPIFLDPKSELGSAFNARSIPTTYIVDKEGRVIGGIVGSRMYDGPEVIALFEDLASK